MKSSAGIMSHDHIPTNNMSVVNGNKISGVKVPGGSYATSTPKSSACSKTAKTITWNREVPPEKLSFTMRREIDKAKEETDLINQLRNVSTIIFY